MTLVNEKRRCDKEDRRTAVECAETASVVLPRDHVELFVVAAQDGVGVDSHPVV